MSDRLVGKALELNVSVEAAAVLAARLHLIATGDAGDPAITRQLDHVLELAGLASLVASVTASEAAMVAGMLRANLLQAAELMAAPGRSPGWVYDDPSILAGQGKASSFIPRTIHASEAHMPGLGERLARTGARLLDIGSGVGELSIAACRVWPTIEVVGVDPWEPAMTLARRNVAAAGLSDRIELRLGLVEDLPASDDFALVWLPGPFLPRAARPRVLEASFRLLEPSGWAVFGLYAGPPDSLAIALMNLRTLRSGGEPIAAEQAATELTSAGFVDVGVLPRTWEGPASYVVGRKP